MTIPSHYNPKAGYSYITIYHTGPNDYRLVDTREGEEVGKERSISQACSKAKQIVDGEAHRQQYPEMYEYI